MNEYIKIVIGTLFLIFGWFGGKVLAKVTEEELESGKKWFILLIYAGFIGSIISLFFRNDVLMFTFLFISIVTYRSFNFKH